MMVPYHLRVNKAVDRFILVEAVRILQDLFPDDKYVYIGFGGPFLEDFRVMSNSFPAMEMVCLEKVPQVSMRQRFHVCSRLIDCQEITLRNYFRYKFPEDRRVILWMDYTHLANDVFEDLQSVLPRIRSGSAIRLTVRCQGADWLVKSGPPEWRVERQAQLIQEFNRLFRQYLPREIADSREFQVGFEIVVQQMIRLAIDEVLASVTGRGFQITSSTAYSDGTGMVSVTGIVCEDADRERVVQRYRNWRYANLDWNTPTPIDLPILSLSERLYLERYLPAKKENALIEIHDDLGHWIGEDNDESIRMLRQFAEFRHLYSQFVRIGL